MADWPELAELKQKLDITSTDWDEHLERLLEASIEQVQKDIGEDVDEPTASLSHAALLLAVNIGATEGEPDLSAAARSPKYQRLLKGHRVRFGVA